MEALWARWLAGNGCHWANEVELQRTSDGAWDKLGGGRWASRLRGADHIGGKIDLLDKAMSTLLRESKSWAGGEPLGGWWQDREEVFCGKVDALRIRLAEALYEEPGKAGKICKEAQALLTCNDVAAAQSTLQAVDALAEAQHVRDPCQMGRILHGVGTGVGAGVATTQTAPAAESPTHPPPSPPPTPLSPHPINCRRLWRPRCGGDERRGGQRVPPIRRCPVGHCR